MQENLKRMIDLVTEIFDVKNNPQQIDVTPEVMQKLELIHRATITEIKNEDGPIAWFLIIPTTADVMQLFLSNEISEAELLERTNAGDKFEAIYLCSATVLEEFRNKGLAKNAIINAVKQLVNSFPITALYFWKFSEDGARLAKALSEETLLPLYTKM